TSDADLCIAAHAATREQRTLNTFYDGFSGGGGLRGARRGAAAATARTEGVGRVGGGSLDGHTQEADRRGAPRQAPPSQHAKNTAAVNKAIDKMFKNVPPLSKSN